MRTGLLARKEGMSRVFMEDGSHLPVTVLSVEHCQVVAQLVRVSLQRLSSSWV